MVRIKIKDLPKDMKISKEEMKKITGGMMPPDTKSGGYTIGFPDVYFPLVPQPVPIPYPNVVVTVDYVDSLPKVTTTATKVTTTKGTTATEPSDSITKY